MNADRRVILGLLAMGRITPAEAERLLVAWNESRETAWILVAGFAFALLAQVKLHQLLPLLMHVIDAQIPALAHLLPSFTRGLGGLL